MEEPGFKPSLTLLLLFKDMPKVSFSPIWLILLDGDGMHAGDVEEWCHVSSTATGDDSPSETQLDLDSPSLSLNFLTQITSLGLSFLIYKLNLFNGMIYKVFSPISFQVASSF